MKLFDNIKKAFGSGVDVAAATQLPSPPTPVVKNKQQTTPSFLTTAKPDPKSNLILFDRGLANTDITTLRTSGTTRDVIRAFIKSSPDMSAAVTAYIRVGITSGYTAVAKNLDGTLNPEATRTLMQVLTRMNILNDYTIGFDDGPSIRSSSEAFALDLMNTGSMSGELVLDKARLPDKIQPIATSQIVFKPSSDGKRVRPFQKVGGDEIDLDVPTFFMVSLDQHPLDVYSSSPVETALQGVLFSAQFMNDLRRVVQKAIHPRVVVTIDEEKLRKTIPKEILYDEDKLQAYMAGLVADLEQRVNNLAPEDALILFDTLGIDIKDHGNTNLDKEYEVIQGLADSKLIAGSKTLPTVLGKGSGTSNMASAEVLLFTKYVEGAIWAKLNEMYSKMLTLAVRLLGHDVYVEFSYNTIDLRPDSELESFRSMKQSRILDLLSLGMLTDEQASIILTGQLPPAGYKPLSGTGFRANTSSQPAGDGYNGASNSGSTMNQNLKSDAPDGAKGGQKK